jgi:ubiquinone/menaquinone biosynthesis C-methylase UbiE
MVEQHAAFIGTVPRNYDQYLGPLLFHQYADDLVARLPVSRGMQVLEIACGTGIVTERLLRRLAGQGTLIATDLNDAMIAQARARIADDPAVEWRQADGTSLPFSDRTFDAAVCEFGLMFFPDKVKGAREAFRVLKPGGTYLFNVWDRIERNPVVRIAHETFRVFFPDDPPQFYQTPFNLHDTALVRSLLDTVGFADVECVHVEKVGQSPSAAEAAIGLVEGNPVYGAIMERRPDALPDIKAAVARNIVAKLGDRPVRCALSAFVFSARRPR